MNPHAAPIPIPANAIAGMNNQREVAAGKSGASTTALAPQREDRYDVTVMKVRRGLGLVLEPLQLLGVQHRRGVARLHLGPQVLLGGVEQENDVHQRGVPLQQRQMAPEVGLVLHHGVVVLEEGAGLAASAGALVETGLRLVLCERAWDRANASM